MSLSAQICTLLQQLQEELQQIRQFVQNEASSQNVDDNLKQARKYEDDILQVLKQEPSKYNTKDPKALMERDAMIKMRKAFEACVAEHKKLLGKVFIKSKKMKSTKVKPVNTTTTTTMEDHEQLQMQEISIGNMTEVEQDDAALAQEVEQEFKQCNAELAEIIHAQETIVAPMLEEQREQLQQVVQVVEKTDATLEAANDDLKVAAKTEVKSSSWTAAILGGALGFGIALLVAPATPVVVLGTAFGAAVAGIGTNKAMESAADSCDIQIKKK